MNSATGPRRPRRVRRALLIAVTLIALIFLAGPRARVEAPGTLPSVPEDVAGYIRDSESTRTDIIAGTEKTVVWADPESRARTPLALVYLHGFSATRQETEPLTRLVAASLGANVFYTRLSGHGRGPEALGEARAGQWMQDTLEAYAIGERLGQRVVVIGVSTGAALGAWLASRSETGHLAGLVMISPNFGLANRSAAILTWPWGSRIARLVAGDEYSFEPLNPEHGRFWTTRYPIEATVRLMSLVDHIDSIDPATISVPTLYVRSDRDRVIDIDAADSFYDRIGAPTRAMLVVEDSDDPYGHVIAGDILSPSTTEALAESISAFVRSIESDQNVSR